MRVAAGCRFFLLVLCSALPARADDTITITAVTAPLTLQAATGQAYTLEGLSAPDLPAATAALRSLATGQTYPAATTPPDRWNRQPLQAPALTLALLRAGWVQLQPEQRPPTPEEQAAEDEASRAQRGLWDEACCHQLTADTAARGLNSWRIIRGTVTAVSPRHDMVYVNFGPDWRTDFTLLLRPALARRLHPEQWTGQTIEVRGWVEWYYGPAIRITAPAQIRLPDSRN